MNPSRIEDTNFVIKCKAGDTSAFEKLFHKYGDRLYYFAMRYIISKEEAEELVQDIFIKIWENRSDLKEDLSFSSYLFTIAKNNIFNQKRKKINEQAYRKYLTYFSDQTHSRTENQIIYSDLKKLLDNTIETLPPQRKLIYQLSRNEGLSHKEIAEQLSISVKTVESHIRLALQTVREVIGKEVPIAVVLFALWNIYF